MKATPQASALLPETRDSAGVGVKIVGAGFGTLREVEGASNRTVPLFYVDTRVTPPDTKTSGGIEHPWAVLKRLRGPRGETIYPDYDVNLGETSRQVFSRVNPAWKSVTAIWETIAPGAPADISGKFKARYSLAGALPTRENPVTTPNTQLETPQGTTVTLTSIAADYAANKTTYAFNLSRPTAATSATTSIDFVTPEVRDDQNRLLSERKRGFDGRKPGMKLIFGGVPAPDATQATISFDLVEQSPRWRQREFYRTLEIEVPVAALFALQKQEADENKTEPPESLANQTYRAENGEFRARIERADSEQQFRAKIWVAPLNANVGAPQTVAEPVALRARNAAGEFVPLKLEPKDIYNYFHDDSTPIAPGENWAEVRAKALAMGAQTTLALDVQSRERAEHFIDVRDIPIQPGQTQTLPRPASNNALWLRDVIWTSAETAAQIERISGERLNVPAGALVLVLVHAPFGPNNALNFDYTNASDDTSGEALKNFGFWNGDALNGATDNAWTLVLSPPATDATHIDVRVIATEKGPIQSRATLEFPNVKWTDEAPIK